MVPAHICPKAQKIIQMGLILPWCMARGTGTKATTSPGEDLETGAVRMKAQALHGPTPASQRASNVYGSKSCKWSPKRGGTAWCDPTLHPTVPPRLPPPRPGPRIAGFVTSFLPFHPLPHLLPHTSPRVSWGNRAAQQHRGHTGIRIPAASLSVLESPLSQTSPGGGELGRGPPAQLMPPTPTANK